MAEREIKTDIKTQTRRYSGISNLLARASLMQKLTLAYVFAVLLPTLGVGLYFYNQSQNYVKDIIIRNAETGSRQVADAVLAELNMAEKVADNIAYNKYIQDFLYRPFTSEAADYEYYNNFILRSMEQALNFSEVISQTNIYTSNTSNPESSRILKEERMRDVDWYQDFINSSREDLWIYPNFRGHYKRNVPRGDERVATYVKKVKSITGKFGMYLGTIAVDIAEKDMYLAMNSFYGTNGAAYVLDGRWNILYTTPNAGGTLEAEIVSEAMRSKEKYFFAGEDVYVVQPLEPLNVTILAKVPAGDTVKNTRLPSRNIILVVALGVILLEVITYFILKTVFSRIKQIVNVMNGVAKGNFNIRIPVTQHDEVGQLAEDFNVLIKKINSLVQDLIKKETAHKDAQMTALQYQINPHFIYNTIDTFRMRMELDGSYDTAEAVAAFGKILRYNINGRSKFAILGEELQHVENYMNIQKLRLGDRILMDWDVCEELRQMKVLRFILQPVVENSIKHAMPRGKQQLLISVKIKVEMDILEITVEDNGRGIRPERLAFLNQRLKFPVYADDMSAEESIGLMNINDRLRLFYGEQYHIRLESVVGKYTRTIIQISVLVH